MSYKTVKNEQTTTALTNAHTSIANVVNLFMDGLKAVLLRQRQRSRQRGRGRGEARQQCPKTRRGKAVAEAESSRSRRGRLNSRQDRGEATP